MTAVSTRKNCWEKESGAPVMRNQTLAARETADILMISFTDPLKSFAGDEKLMCTLGYALQTSGARLLELDSRELGVLVASAGDLGSGLGAVIYDNVPGGAGHVRELLSIGRRWLEDAQVLLRGSDQHHKICDTACLDCLLTFDAQQAMNRGLLRRRKAFEFLDSLLAGRLPTPEVDSKPIDVPVAEKAKATKAERLARAGQRRGKKNDMECGSKSAAFLSANAKAADLEPHSCA